MSKQSERLDRFVDVLNTSTSTYRINWLQPNDERTHYGEWVYTDKEEAQRDAERFVKMPFVSSAWVEERKLDEWH